MFSLIKRISTNPYEWMEFLNYLWRASK